MRLKIDHSMRSGNNDGIHSSIQRSLQIKSESILRKKHPLPNIPQKVR